MSNNETTPTGWTTECHIALREAHEIKAERDYFDARPGRDSEPSRELFDAGFRRGFDTAAELLSSSPQPPAAQHGEAVVHGKNSGHGHVVPRADGVRARCGGPAICAICQREKAALEATKPAAAPQPVAQIEREGVVWINANPRAMPIGTKLYTAPPARQALTDEQIDKLIPPSVFGGYTLADGKTHIDEVWTRNQVRAAVRACAESWGVKLVGIGGKGGASK